GTQKLAARHRKPDCSHVGSNARRRLPGDGSQGWSTDPGCSRKISSQQTRSPMPEKIVPMIHVPDVAFTARWYESIGFTIRDTARECDEGEVNWALLRLGESTIMLNAGGKSSDAPRRDFDLYIYVDDIDAVRKRLDGKARVVEDLHDTFYGIREFI